MDISGISPDRCLQRLIEGNRNFAGGSMYFPNRGIDRRRAVVQGQQPFAAVLSCSDSRVPPELVFGQGLGDLYVVRTAGHIVDDITLGSLEYGVVQRGVCLVVVLGHEGCGAVTAVVHGYELPGHVAEVLRYVRPAVEEVQPHSTKDNFLQNAILANIRRTVLRLTTAEPVIKKAVQEERVKVAGALYHLESGLVEWVN